MEIVVLEHERACPTALFGDWARERGHTLRTLRVPDLARWPDATAADAVVSLGSDRSTHASPEEWIEREIDFLRGVHDASVPVLGICFGAQALSRALGGTVWRAARIELEWTPIDTLDADLIPSGPWLRWHEDLFSVPPAARELARAGEIPVAFRQHASVGIQFHPEADAALAESWIDGSRGQLVEHAIDETELRSRLQPAASGALERAYDLFDRIARFWLACAEPPHEAMR